MAFDLSKWYLILPVDGSDSDKYADVLRPAKEKLPYFDVRDNGNTFQFFAPEKGATTPNSSSTRSELTQNADLAWSSKTFTYTVRVSEQTAEHGTTIGQIWSEKRNGPMIELFYKSNPADTKIGYNLYHPTNESGGSRIFSWTPKINETFQIRMRVAAGKVSVKLTQGAQTQEFVDPVTYTGKYRFKFGAYNGFAIVLTSGMSLAP